MAGDDDRLVNLLGAFGLAVADRVRADTEAAVGHSGAAAAALVMIAQFPGRTVEFLRRAVGLSHPAAVRVADRLVDDGLVRRRVAGPGPAVALPATAEGRPAARRGLDVRGAAPAAAPPALSAPGAPPGTPGPRRAPPRPPHPPGTATRRL